MAYVKKTPLEKLQNKKARLGIRLKKEQARSQQTFNNLGWGSGMRRVKLVSFSAEHNTTEQIRKVDKEIERLEVTS